MSSLGVVPNGVPGSQTDPLWDWPVLLHGPAHLGLDLERLVRRPREEGGRRGGGGAKMFCVSLLVSIRRFLV